jgi:hypothetical protein
MKKEKKSLFINSILYKAKTKGGNLNSEKSQDYAQKPQRNCTVMNSTSGYTQISSQIPEYFVMMAAEKTVANLVYYRNCIGYRYIDISSP